jgi:hypothetical protein
VPHERYLCRRGVRVSQQLAFVRTPNVAAFDRFVPFWVRWTDTTITVGQV